MNPPEIPGTILGLYQWIIGTLVLVVSSLAGANVFQWKASVEVNKARLTERDVLNKALNDANATLVALNETARSRNEVMDKLGELIGQMSVALKMLTERIDMQNGRTNKDLETAIEAVQAMAEALRTISSEMRQNFTEVKAGIKAGQ
jgi:chromosome segregation ATPase